MSILTLEEVHASYSGGSRVLHGISFTVSDGGVTALLGSNGAGKTTTLRTISGITHRRGTIRFAGTDITGMRTDKIARLGIAHVPQGRGTLPGLTVRDNLEAGAIMRRDRAAVRADMARYLDLFPRLAERATQRANTLSGGEQQMLAIARALMGAPRLLLLDEPSLGLAPKVTQDVFRTIATLQEQTQISMLIVEQNSALALQLADHVVLLENGRIAASGTPTDLMASDAIRRAYLG
jgi:branched-chain amino acid transport system ATP-binding protein